MIDWHTMNGRAIKFYSGYSYILRIEDKDGAILSLSNDLQAYLK